jgi:hypothetical protein
LMKSQFDEDVDSLFHVIILLHVSDMT